jgi:predicted TPR repeat methyltransferase
MYQEAINRRVDFQEGVMSAQQSLSQTLIPIDYKTRTTCRGCGSINLQLLIDYGFMPLAGGFMRPDEVTTRNIAYPLRLARCTDCTLMQVLDTVPPEKIFSQYSYASSTTHTLIDHFAEMAQEIVDTFAAQGKLVVEFGCNDGILIRPLRQAGAVAVGVDPSDVALRASQDQDWPLIQDYFNETVAAQVKEKYGPASIVVGNNVFAHVDDIHAIVCGVTALLEDEGVYIFEVHYQGDLINTVQFDTVYHEHICYYSLTALIKLLSQHDMKVIDVQHISIHAGSIRVIVARESSTRPISQRVTEMLESEKKLDIDRFVRQVHARRTSIQKLIGDLHKAGRRVVAYGAAGRMTIMLNYCNLGADLIEYVLDMSPLRHGKIVPGILIPIVPPQIFHEALPDYAIMTAWNYEPEIVAKEQKFLKWGGRFIIPLPDVRIVGEV